MTSINNTSSPHHPHIPDAFKSLRPENCKSIRTISDVRMRIGETINILGISYSINMTVQEPATGAHVNITKTLGQVKEEYEKYLLEECSSCVVCQKAKAGPPGRPHITGSESATASGSKIEAREQPSLSVTEATQRDEALRTLEDSYRYLLETGKKLQTDREDYMKDNPGNHHRAIIEAYDQQIDSMCKQLAKISKSLDDATRRHMKEVFGSDGFYNKYFDDSPALDPPQLLNLLNRLYRRWLRHHEMAYHPIHKLVLISLSWPGTLEMQMFLCSTNLEMLRRKVDLPQAVDIIRTCRVTNVKCLVK